VREKLLLGLRLDEPLALRQVDRVVDPRALERLERLGLAARSRDGGVDGDRLVLTPRGRFVGGAVTADLLA
jgi:hypothetical protein